MKTIISLVVLLSLAGCGLQMAQDELNSSSAALVKCWRENGNKSADPCGAEQVRYQMAVDDMNRRQAALDRLGAMGNNQTPTVSQTAPAPKMWMQQVGGKTYSCNSIGGMVNCY